MACALFFCGRIFAEDSLTTPAAEPKVDAAATKEKSQEMTITPHGFAGVQTFRIMGFKNLDLDYGPQNFNNSVLNFTFDIGLGKRYTISAGLEGYVSFSTVPYNSLGKVGRTEQASPLWSWYMAAAEMAYSFKDSTDPFYGYIGIGLFPYQYDVEARNLGEYLFSRTGTYPGWITTTFDWTKSRLTGLLLSTNLFHMWKNDLMLTTEMQWFPFYDLSFSWVSSIPIGKFLDFGAGISFCRFMSANSRFTTPPITIDPQWNVPNYYIKDNGDTAFYTFAGTKAMARATFNLKGIFPNFKPSEKLGHLAEEDGKIFGELGILGWANQGTVYDTLWQRMPVMFGLNIPTFNLLDVFSVQGEYYGSPYPNDYTNQIEFNSKGVPQPTQGSGWGTYGNVYSVIDSSKGHYTNFYANQFTHWKWSVYARRWFGPHLAVVGQIARDHWRTSTPYGYYQDFEDALLSDKDFYWALKIVSVW
jgi:hypothetical protein